MSLTPYLPKVVQKPTGMQRVFSYSDSMGCFLNIIAFLDMMGAGVALPLMDVVFGRFVDTIHNFVNGKLPADEYMDQVGELTFVNRCCLVIFALLVAAQALTQIAPQTVAISKAMAAAQDLLSIIDRQSAIDPLSQSGETIEGLRGVELEDLNLRWPRTNIRLVQQEPALFSGTIYQNVVDGLTGTDKEHLPDEMQRRLVIDACKAAFARGFVKDLPDGYDTWIGERGASLSGGQKQRVVIARSIISNPKVLLLDEDTSALDPNAEKVVQVALNNVAKGQTTVIIAHRLSTICDADNIVVMSKGETVENGTHAELIEQGGVYARLVRAQDLGKTSESIVDESEDDKDGALVDMKQVLTQVSTTGAPHEEASSGGKRCGLLRGLILFLKEQRTLWWPSFAILLACFAGGGTYPALAILFSRTMSAFETIDADRGNFFALMFFAVASGNLVPYAVTWHSSMKPKTERNRGRTTIAVAHRLSTIRDADVIAVLAEGNIVESGTHDELVGRKKGLCFEMALGQSLDREARHGSAKSPLHNFSAYLHSEPCVMGQVQGHRRI
ncbi:multidrug resistance protein 1 [Metarhizium album ARSEF 1941]|uniref:Multidrug resistance protein 1 n=1 Tax=Metarhizium album (strain ARSEF 1941) TaxID=1081103 RepID=A0A0B2WEX4_METAS|nr:multidrug resistance protein 1 [Metarhizium album ARSEF 1941]KHN94431.1 multidrug resistance protein 1 [Metarhizium album ARSEF 1941]